MAPELQPEKPVATTKAVKVEIDEAADSAASKVENGAEKAQSSVKKATSEALDTVEKAAKATSGTRKPAARKPATAKTKTETDAKTGIDRSLITDLS